MVRSITLSSVFCLAFLSAASLALAQDAKIAHGMKVYETQKCMMCHSIEGKGQKAGPLDGVGSKYSAEEMRQWMVAPKEMEAKTGATRKPAMRAYPNLPKEDLDALVAYMLSLKKK